MKSPTKPALRVVPAAPVQFSLNVQGVLSESRACLPRPCVAACKAVLAKMMDLDRQAVCGAKNVPDAHRAAVRGGTPLCSASMTQLRGMLALSLCASATAAIDTPGRRPSPITVALNSPLCRRRRRRPHQIDPPDDAGHCRRCIGGPTTLRSLSYLGGAVTALRGPA